MAYFLKFFKLVRHTRRSGDAWWDCHTLVHSPESPTPRPRYSTQGRLISIFTCFPSRFYSEWKIHVFLHPVLHGWKMHMERKTFRDKTCFVSRRTTFGWIKGTVLAFARLFPCSWSVTTHVTSLLRNLSTTWGYEITFTVESRENILTSACYIW